MTKTYLDNPWALKIDLMLMGVRIEDPVVKALACGTSGIDMMLPQGILVNIPCAEPFTKGSPYSVKKKGDGYVITGGKGSIPVKMVERPSYCGKKTSTGVLFTKIASCHGRYTVITPSPKCDFFSSNIECRYCAGNFDVKDAPDTVYSVEEVCETVEEVLKDKASDIIYLSIGFSSGDGGGIEFLKPYIQAIKKRFSCLVAVEALPPKDNRWIDEVYAAGADSVLYNLEIFDKELFELICPGRASLIGRKRYLDALKYAAKVFPNGTVASHLIVGLEPPGSTCMGIDYLTDLGVVPILPIYRPGPGKALRIEPLTAEIIIPIYKHLYTALKRKNINFNWVRDISMVTTPVEGRFLTEGEEGEKSIFEGFYSSKIGLKAAWGLSTIRRKLRVKEVGEEEKEPSKH